MGVWDSYNSRIGKYGKSSREVMLRREQEFLRRKLQDGNLSYHHVVIGGEDREVAIINSDNFEIKTIISMPGENLISGSIVEWMDNHWLITSKDYNNEVYTKCTMTQCNYLVRWIAADGNIIERWCVISDGTKLAHLKCACLAYWKRYVKTTPLIAGIPLEPFRLQRSDERRASANA